MSQVTVAEKPKRGRPRAWYAPTLRDASFLSDLHSVRGKQNRMLAVNAMSVLKDAWEPAFAWFWKLAPTATFHEASMHSPCTPRWTALVELARFHPDLELCLRTARAIAALPLKTTTRSACIRIQAVRFGAFAPEDLR